MEADGELQKFGWLFLLFIGFMSLIFCSFFAFLWRYFCKNDKVNRKKILELGTENIHVKNQNFQILDIKNCQNFTQAQIDMANISFENYPNIFVISLQVLCLKSDDINPFLKFLIKKIPNNRDFYLQINYVKSKESQVYHKARRIESFVELFDLNNNLDLIKNLESSYFFEILNAFKNLLVKVGFKNTLMFLGLSSDKRIYFLIKRAMKANDANSVRLLMFFVNELSQDLLDETLKTKNVDILILVLNNFTVKDVSKKQIKKILSDEICDKLLIKISSQNNFNILKILVKNRKLFMKLLKYQTWCEAIKNARDKSFFKFFSQLQEFEIIFYKLLKEEHGEPSSREVNFNSDQIPSQNEVEEFHTFIESANLEQVKEIVRKFPFFKFFFNVKFEAALEKALSCKKFEIYAFLMSEDFLVYNQTKFNSIMNQLSDLQKKTIEDENLKFVRKNPDNFIDILATKIDLSKGALKLSFAEIRKMLEKLKERKENREVMRIASQAEVEIIFDFVTESVNRMVPNCDECFMGVTRFGERILYVGKNESENQRYGTFAHEMMHFVYFLIYKHDCLPYCKGDTVREAEWVEVVKKVKAQYESNPEGTDNIIKWVFECYGSEYQQRFELAVSFNDMLAFYHNDPAKIIELEALHPELFSYIRTKVLADFKIPNVYRMIKLNNDFGLLQRTEGSELQVKPTVKSEILDLVTEDSKRVLIVTNVPQLMLSKIRNEIENLPGNKLNLKVRNIFVDAKVLEQKHVKDEFLNLIETTEVDRIIAGSSNLKELLNDLKPEVQCFYFASEVDEELVSKYNFTVHEINIKWKELTIKTQNLLKNKFIKFQNLSTNLSKVLFNAEGLITPEILTILCSNHEIKVNCESEVEKLEKFIDRTVQMKTKVKVSDDSMKQGLKLDQEIEFYEDDAEPQSHEFNQISQHAGTFSGSKSKKVKFALIHEDFSLEDFIDKTQREQILVISDVAGSGKTTLLSKIHEILMKNFPDCFIIFFGLLKHVDELTEGVGESFTDFIAKVLKFNKLEKEIFMQKYEKGEVKILFDAFDEISPKCKENTTQLFQNFLNNGKNQIFITTRTHLEHDLEKDLKVLAYRIKNLTKEEQVAFVVEYWGNKDRVLVEKRAKKLVNKISEIIATKTSLIGVPLIVQGLAEAFKDKIDENFDREIENLEISSIYEKIVENFFSKFKNWCLQNNPKIIENMTMSPLQLHQYLAVCLFFNEEFANSLGLNHDEDEWPHEEIARCGLIKYDKDGKFHFNHQTNAEHFTAGFTFHLLKTVKKLSSVNLDFIFQVLREKKFEVVRMFLESKLNKVEKVQDLKSFNSSQQICEKVKNDKNFLQLCMSEELFDIFAFFALVIKEGDLKLFKEVIELKDDEFEATNLMQILPYATNLTKFENFLNEILSFYSENIFDDFLLKVDNHGDTILNCFAGKCKNKHIFECFWNKIKVLFTDEVKLKSFLLMKGYIEGNALLKSIAWQNENTFYFLFEHVFCKIFNIKKFAYSQHQKSNKNGGNLLHYLARYGSVSMLKFTIEKLKKEFSPEDLQNFIKLKSKKGFNLLHCVALENKNEKSVEFLVNFIKNEVGSEEVKKMLSELYNFKALPLHCAVQYNNFKVFKLFFSLYEQNFNKVQLLQFLCEKDDNFLHRAAALTESKEDFEFLWMKIDELFEDKKQLKKYLLEKGRYQKNALMMSIFAGKETYFYFLFDVYCKLFNIKEFAYETDEFGNNLFFRLASHGSDSILIFTLNEVKNRFSHEDFQDLIKFKNEYGYNLLNRAAENENCKNFEIILSFYEQILNCEELKSIMCFRPFHIFNPEHAKREKMLDKYRESPKTQFSNDQEKR